MELVGRITDEATLVERGKGGYFVYFCIVINKRMRQQDRTVKTQEFINCRYWNDMQIAASLHKDGIVKLNGSLSEVPYTDPHGEIHQVQNLYVTCIRLITKNTIA